MNYLGILRLCTKHQLSYSKVKHLQPLLLEASHIYQPCVASSYRLVSTEAFEFLNNRNGSRQTAVDKVKTYFRKHKLKAAGFSLYESYTDRLDYPAFMSELDLPDTFHSWFLITELHTWMLMTRLMANPHEGRLLRNNLVEALWKDVSTRAKKLGDGHSSVIKNQIYELNEGFQAALVLYDEGLLSNDKVLASAIWRRFYSQNCASAHHLEAMVYYIRHSMHDLDSIELDELVGRPTTIKWISIGKILENLDKK